MSDANDPVVPLTSIRVLWHVIRRMDATLKEEIQEIIELVKTVPEPLQLRILELLLQDTLNRAEGKKPKRESESEPEDDTPETKPSTGRCSS